MPGHEPGRIYIENSPTSISQIVSMFFDDNRCLKEETVFKYTDADDERFLVADLDFDKLIQFNIYDIVSSCWIKDLVDVKTGDSLKTIGPFTFAGCKSLRSITFSKSVGKIGQWAFIKCGVLCDVTFEEKTMETVSHMENYSHWGLAPGCTIHCKDGDIEVK
jgi:hypothetical protein